MVFTFADVSQATRLHPQSVRQIAKEGLFVGADPRRAGQMLAYGSVGSRCIDPQKIGKA